MPNLFQFSNQAPSDGEIRAFVKDDIDGTKIVRALTVDNNALDGRNIIPTLQNLQSVNMRLTGSGDFSNLEKISIAQRPTYFFIDNIDLSLNTVSSSLSSSVTFDPFLSTNFLNNDYNVLISNAREFRPYGSRRTLERTSGEVDPTNYEAALGIQTRNLTLAVSSSGVDIPTSITSSFNGALSSGNNFHQFTGSYVRIPNHEDLTLTITVNDLKKAFGDFDSAVVPQTTVAGENYQFVVGIDLRLDAEKEFNNPSINLGGSGGKTPLLYYVLINGQVVQKRFFPVHHVIPSGSAATATGGGTADVFFYARLEAIYWRQVPSYTVTTTATWAIKPRILEIDNKQTFIKARFTKNQPGSGSYRAYPYAQPASIPESMYTSTGLSNARYKGSKTSAADYGGIDPAITAQPITILRLTEGPISSSNDSTIGNYGRSWLNMNNILSGLSGSDGQRAEYEQLYEEVAFDGLRDEPLTKVGVAGQFYFGSNFDTLSSDLDTTVDITTAGFGDRIQIGDNLTFVSASSTETLKITSKVPKVNQTSGKNFIDVFSCEVLRGQGANGTTNSGSVQATPNLTLEQGDRLLKIEGSKVVPLETITAVLKPQKVKDSPDDMIIVETDYRGFIVQQYTSGSQNGTAN